MARRTNLERSGQSSRKICEERGGILPNNRTVEKKQ